MPIVTRRFMSKAAMTHTVTVRWRHRTPTLWIGLAWDWNRHFGLGVSADGHGVWLSLGWLAFAIEVFPRRN